MSAPPQQTPSSCPECSERALELRAHAEPSTLASTYNTRAEIDLSQSGISLGAIAALPRLANPTLIDFHQAFPGKCVLWVVGHISLLNAASGASNRMDEPSLNLCALDIINTFPHITLGEFCVFCARMRGLKYVRKRSEFVFSSDTIMQGLREFIKDRDYEIDKYEREHRDRVNMTGCVTRENIDKEEYDRAYKAEMQRIMHEQQATPHPRKSTTDYIKDFAKDFRPQEAMMSEEEFCERKRRQIEEVKKKYGCDL